MMKNNKIELQTLKEILDNYNHANDVDKAFHYLSHDTCRTYHVSHQDARKFNISMVSKLSGLLEMYHCYKQEQEILMNKQPAKDED